MAIETEIRTLVPSKNDALAALQANGFVEEDSFLQHDIMFDRPDGSLFLGGEKIRIRLEKEKATLTYKGKSVRDDGVSQREELDISLPPDQINSVGAFLTAIGYPMLFQVQKNRAVLSNGKVQATIDDWPIIGAMLEFEGEESAILAYSESIFPNSNFGNPRLKTLFEDHCASVGKSLEELKGDYLEKTGFDLGNISFLLK